MKQSVSEPDPLIDGTRWRFFLIGAFSLCILTMVVFPPSIFRKGARLPENRLPPESLKRPVGEILTAQDLPWRVVKTPGGREQWVVRVPADLPIPLLHLAVQEAVLASGGWVHPGESEPVSGRLSIGLGWPDSVLFSLVLVPIWDWRRERGRVAILIDDFGDRWDAFTAAFFELPVPITISVIPGLPMSKRVALEATTRRCEILLHLPMQAKDKTSANMTYLIHQDLMSHQVLDILGKALDEVPGAVGVNNHMGSRVTKDRRIMGYVLEGIRQRRLFFVDSRTTPESVAFTMAREMGIPCAQRDVFIDHMPHRDAIERELRRLAQRAEKEGEALGIGHCHPATLEALRRMLPRLQEEGFRFVRVSELVR